jgi:eukaryotic-like serine/threonine-protein kinase
MSDPTFPSQNSDDDATRLIAGSMAVPAVLQPGTVLGHTYVIKARLGRGGMGEVYRARHIELGTEHAIKIMLPSFANDPKIVQLFRDEALKLGRVNNLAVVKYEGFFRDEHGLRYLVTEFVHGESLEQILRRRRLEPNEVLRLRDRLALGLAAAHEMDIVHRDVSPENILLPEGSVDQAKLIDFGIAKSMTAADPTLIGDTFAGKYSFASPEQCGLYGGTVDLRSDIYSLGLVLAAAAIGFGKKLEMGNSPATMLAARQRVPDLSAVPPPLRRVIAPMLEPWPDHRPPSMGALLGHESEASQRSVPGATPAIAGSWRRALLAGVLGAAIAVIVFLLPDVHDVLRREPPPPTSRTALGTDATKPETLPAPPSPPPHLPAAKPPLEALNAALAGIDCASLIAGASGDDAVVVKGSVPDSEQQAKVQELAKKYFPEGRNEIVADVVPPPIGCTLAAFHRMRPPGGTGAGELDLRLDNGGNQLHENQPFGLRVRSPNYPVYLRLDYFGLDGKVWHMKPDAGEPEPKLEARTTGEFFKTASGRDWLGGDPSSGTELIAAVATPTPLDLGKRQQTEEAADYLPDLEQAFARIGSNSGHPGLVATLLVKTSGR